MHKSEKNPSFTHIKQMTIPVIMRIVGKFEVNHEILPDVGQRHFVTPRLRQCLDQGRLLGVPGSCFHYHSSYPLPECPTPRTESQSWSESVHLKRKCQNLFHLQVFRGHGKLLSLILTTTLQSIMNDKLSQRIFWHCNENRLIKKIQTIPHNLQVSVKSDSIYQDKP